MVQLFRTKYALLLNSDGTTTLVELTNANCAFVFSGSSFGSDSNSGTRTSPFATLNKALSTGALYILHRGTDTSNIIFPNPYVAYNIIGDCGDSFINGIMQIVSIISVRIINLRILTLYAQYGISVCQNCIITNLYGGNYGIVSFAFINNLITNLYLDNYSTNVLNRVYSKNTIINFLNYTTVTSYLDNGIFINSIDFFRYRSQTTTYPILRNWLLRKSNIWLWNGNNIPIVFGKDQNAWIQDLRNSLTIYANTLNDTEKAYLLLIVANTFSLNSTGGESCKVIDDINNVPIFNRYSGTTPVDYSLLLDANNQTLYMSSNNDFVGAFSGNVGNMIFNEITDVDVTTGLDTVNSPDLLAVDVSGNYYAVSNSLQYWNRVITNTLKFARGYSFNGINSLLKSGITQRYFYGKLQPFTINNVPVESVEVIPYDNLTTPSVFPKFSAKFYGTTQMYYHNTGAKNGQPVLFSDLLGDFAITTNKNLSIYGNWAVTDADSENYELSGASGCTLTPILLTWFVFELNIHYSD
jgi:hypothetical protein